MEYHRRSFVTDDERLRHNGFTIVSRPRHGPNIWVDWHRILWFEHHALEYLADQEAKAEKMAAEDRKKGKR